MRIPFASRNAGYSGFKAVSGGIAGSIYGCGVGHIALGQVIFVVVVVVVVVARRGASTTIAAGPGAVAGSGSGSGSGSGWVTGMCPNRDDYNALIFNGKKNPSVPKNALLAMGRYGQSVWGDMCNVTT